MCFHATSALRGGLKGEDDPDVADHNNTKWDEGAADEMVGEDDTLDPFIARHRDLHEDLIS
jgi:hypothetical protein